MGKYHNGCYLCGAELPFGETFFSWGQRRVCCDCADGITCEELMHLTGTRTERNMLVALGFSRDCI